MCRPAWWWMVTHKLQPLALWVYALTGYTVRYDESVEPRSAGRSAAPPRSPSCHGCLGEQLQIYSFYTKDFHCFHELHTDELQWSLPYRGRAAESTPAGHPHHLSGSCSKSLRCTDRSQNRVFMRGRTCMGRRQGPVGAEGSHDGDFRATIWHRRTFTAHLILHETIIFYMKTALC